MFFVFSVTLGYQAGYDGYSKVDIDIVINGGWL